MITEAKWITTPASYGDNAAEFIKRITPMGRVMKATLTITAAGVYAAYMDGARVGDFILAPGCTVYSKRLQYQSYDITDMVGGTLTVTVGKGWYRSRMSENRPEINTKSCALLAEIELVYTDGKK
ncbi:MAG: alpha-L-rhamnosidase N-terminal domain-containing protein [Clostridia bacterium]|nr:alpha-L-rhamnosidase N-terminal domain-containing protein [Clostridia bacterium]